MTLNNINTLRKDRGFTIVELLIVIVVIAILAAITIVAFTGIQQRGRDSARQSDVSNIVKALTAMTSEGAAWPATAAAAVTALNAYTTANLDTTVTAKIVTYAAGTNPAAGANANNIGYAICTGNQGANLYWYKEAPTAGVQNVKAGSGC